MTEKRPDPAEVAYRIVKERGQPVTTRDLIELVMHEVPSPDEGARRMAEVHTAISLDNRFVAVVKGSWGLREWQPRPKTRVSSHTSKQASLPGSSMKRRYDQGDGGDDDEVETESDAELDGDSGDWD